MFLDTNTCRVSPKSFQLELLRLWSLIVHIPLYLAAAAAGESPEWCGHPSVGRWWPQSPARGSLGCQQVYYLFPSHILYCIHRSAITLRQHGHPDRSAATQPHTQRTAMHCVFWHLSIGTSINFFSNLSSSSSSIGSDNTGQPSLPTCINEPWVWPCRRFTGFPSLDHFW